MTTAFDEPRRRWVAPWAFITGIGLMMSAREVARAQPAALSGTILQLDGSDVVIDVGAAQLSAAQRLLVLREIEVRHPITGKRLRDRFVIGALSVVQTGQALSLAHVVPTPDGRPLAVGDRVELDRPRPEPGAAVLTPSDWRAPESAGPSELDRRSSAGSGAQPTAANRTEHAQGHAPAATARASEPSATTFETRAALARDASSHLQNAGAAPTPEVSRFAGAARTPQFSNAERAPTTADVEKATLGTAWFATLGKPPELRAQIYENFLRRYSSSEYRPTLEREIAQLQSLAESERTARAAREAAERVPPVPRLALAPVTAAHSGEAIELAGILQTAVEVRSVVLYARPLEVPDYAQFPLRIEPGGYVRVQLPASLARTPGFAYFIEGVDAQGRVTSFVGTSRAPALVVVRPAPHAPRRVEPDTSVRFTSEIVSFDGTSGRDYFLVNEGDFLYRLRLRGLVGLRVGYGNYQGRGGSVDQLDRRGLEPSPAGFSYGFVETELELHRLIGVAARGTVGLGRPSDATESRNALTGGFQLRARIGTAQGTRLILAGELMPEIGQRAYIGLRFEAIRSLPMAAEVVVTDQPVHSKELAVRLIYEIGYQLTSRFALALRPSYQLRTITHAGPGLGLAAQFDW